ncbi:carbonyl reductase [NADPH] 3-like isoform X2 [Dreissena polymorpha]|uniref:carbonyl reductase [NADPH] 3-like isoform X2 n=1 Tax=Dreissena polymorpha TaxID=45954 RepID=UPI002264B40D|nr:carbonyl reductase [NADPH] 3-like isoform X2 [Dreissena polymorpha]XP_052229312.1 carbonyl reductase [NADPH] 3-like isoform X2 [Dreissena polymorpha]
MSASKRVAVVTAAKLPLVRGLCKEFQGDVIITARDMARGKDMLNKLNKEGLEPVLHDLDNTDDASLQKFHNFLQKDYGGLDLLVNNAAIVSRNAAFLSFSEQVKFAMAKNFWGTSNICKVLFPLLRPHARVVNMLSGEELGAEWTWSQALRERFLDPELSLAKIEQLMKEFVESAKAGNYKEKGWPDHPYGVTKIGVTLMGLVQQRELNADKRPDIVVNSGCLDIQAVDIDKDTKTSDEVNNNNSSKITKPRKNLADTMLYLALLPPNTSSPKGEYVSGRKIQKIF